MDVKSYVLSTIWFLVAGVLALHFATINKKWQVIWAAPYWSPLIKMFHTIMTFVFPWIWFKLLKHFMPDASEVMTKGTRDKLIREGQAHFYESGKGSSGGSIPGSKF